MNKGLQPGNDVGSLYVSRMDGERGLIGCKTCVKAEKLALNGMSNIIWLGLN